MSQVTKLHSLFTIITLIIVYGLINYSRWKTSGRTSTPRNRACQLSELIADQVHLKEIIDSY